MTKRERRRKRRAEAERQKEVGRTIQSKFAWRHCPTCERSLKAQQDQATTCTSCRQPMKPGRYAGPPVKTDHVTKAPTKQLQETTP
jgi:hypothetical protein